MGLPKVAQNFRFFRLRGQNHDWCVDISKKHERLSRQLSQLFIFSDTLKTVKRWRSTSGLNLSFGPARFSLTLLLKTTLTVEKKITLLKPYQPQWRHLTTISFWLYIKIFVSNRLEPKITSYLSSFISFCWKAPINSILLVKLSPCSYI